ncbi:hypothetical protein V3C99_015193 [Haemonchus contortus]
MDPEKLFREDHTFFKVIVGDFKAKIGLGTDEELHIGAHGMKWCKQALGGGAIKFSKRSPKSFINWDHLAPLASGWEDSVIHNINKQGNQPIDHLHDNARKAESSRVAKRGLPSKDLKQIRQRAIARAAGNHQRTAELKNLCTGAFMDVTARLEIAVAKPPPLIGASPLTRPR